MQRFGSARERREADLFLADLFGRSRAPTRARTRAREYIPETGEQLPEQSGTIVMPPLSIVVTPYMVLDRFEFDISDFRTFHRAGITRVAHLVLDSQGTSEPITTVRLVGHTDSTGTPSHNTTLGQQRAEKVAVFLRAELDRFRPGLSGSITIVVQTLGETRPVASNAVASNRPKNRRVQIFLEGTCRAFFCQYDLRFLPNSPDFGVQAHPTMTAAEQTLREADVLTFVPAPTSPLVSRRDARATASLSGASGTVPAAAPAAASLMPAARRLSDGQLELFREFMPDGAGGIDFDRARTCFEGFANGELRSARTASVGEPNGGFFFLFAEWAFLCIDSGLDAAAWTNLARIFVMCQEMLISVYRPASGPPRTVDDFSFTNFSAARQFSATQKATLRTRYAGMALPAILTAARDNMRRAQTMP